MENPHSPLDVLATCIRQLYSVVVSISFNMKVTGTPRFPSSQISFPTAPLSQHSPYKVILPPSRFAGPTNFLVCRWRTDFQGEEFVRPPVEQSGEAVRQGHSCSEELTCVILVCNMRSRSPQTSQFQVIFSTICIDVYIFNTLIKNVNAYIVK